MEEPTEPMLRCVEDATPFDRMRVNDACLIKRNGAYGMYYKGRRWDDTLGNTASRNAGRTISVSRTPWR